MSEAIEQLTLVNLGAAFSLSAHGLQVATSTPPNLEQCGEGLQRLSRIASRVKFWRGDLMALTETLFAEEASQIIDSELMDERDAKAEIFVATHVGPKTRDLAPHHDPWSYCNAVAKLKPAEQEDYLGKAVTNDWSVAKLKAQIAADKNGGETAMRFLLVVDAKNAIEQTVLTKDLEGRGYHVTQRTGLRKKPKAKTEKKGPVTAKKKRSGAPKMYTRRRPPQ